MEYNVIFPRIFNDIPFNTILYSILRLNRNIISYFFLRSAYSPRRVAMHYAGAAAPSGLTLL